MRDFWPAPNANFITRFMSPANKTPPSRRSVRFAVPNCSAYIHPLNHPEYWAVRYFENHVHSCHACNAPYSRLCRVGLSHAGSIDSYMFHDRGCVVSTSSRRVQLELPYQWQATRELLETMSYVFPREVITDRREERNTPSPGKHFEKKEGKHSGYKTRYVYYR
jgi:hypothetical protein